MCSHILSHLICNIYTDCIISCCYEKWNRTFLPCSCECLLFSLSCWLLPGWFKRANRQLRAMRNTANTRMETAKTLLLCVCLIFVSLRFTEVRDMDFIFSYQLEMDGPFFFPKRSQIRQIVHLNTSEGLGKFRKMWRWILYIELFLFIFTGHLRKYDEGNNDIINLELYSIPDLLWAFWRGNCLMPSSQWLIEKRTDAHTWWADSRVNHFQPQQYAKLTNVNCAETHAHPFACCSY